MSSSATVNAATTDSSFSSSTNSTEQQRSPSWQSYAIGVLLVGTSAGMLLYTRKTGSMLRTLQHVKQPLRPPTKIGPPTKEEWEKIRPRFDDDDIV